MVRCHHNCQALCRMLAVFFVKAMLFLLLFLPLLLHSSNNGSSCCCCTGHEYINLQKKGDETNSSKPSLKQMHEGHTMRPFSSSFSSLSPPDARPPVEKRLYKSVAVEKVIADMEGKLRPPLDVLFSNCWPNTLDTTVVHVFNVRTSGSEENNNDALHEDDDDAFVITGDIRAMWLRDSTNQVLPYAHLLQHDDALQDLFFGLLQRQARSILIDAYANAFNFNDTATTGSQDHQNDKRVPPMQPSIFEGKYELDSLAAFLRLSRAIYESGVAFRTDRSWINAVKRVLDVIEEQQAGTMESFGNNGEQPPCYRFERCEGDLANSGYGPPAFRTGLVKSAFRPSDDPTALPFHVPANAMTAVELQHLGSMMLELDEKQSFGRQKQLTILSKRAVRLSEEIHAALRDHAVVTLPNNKDSNNHNNKRKSTIQQVFAYEVDGFGNALLMDDANTPSLLSLPLLGYDINGGKYFNKNNDHNQYNTTELYRATRSRILSQKNPYYFNSHNSGSPPWNAKNSNNTAATSSYSNKGGGYRCIAGIGSPHTGPGRVWPMALITQALTSDSDEEIIKCLDMLVEMAAATGFMHESVSATNASDFTRSWFAWANGHFGTLVLALAKERPWLVMQRPQQQE